jgi:hypothetical protein
MISPGGALIFHRDMFLDIPLIADLATIQERRQILIDERLRRSNMKRRLFDYEIGQQVLLFLTDKLGKMKAKAIGPFPIQQVHANGNITVGDLTWLNA